MQITLIHPNSTQNSLIISYVREVSPTFLEKNILILTCSNLHKRLMKSNGTENTDKIKKIETTTFRLNPRMIWDRLT